jgi:2-desacetyl-2-hydroxyethyl bacteriochlorophyllide A dehydrogenase
MMLREVEPPQPDPGEVVIEVAYSGICGSELSGFLGQSSIRKPPLIFGHEFSGRIVDTGANTQLAAGARVTANPLIACGNCAYCRAGEEQLCTDRRLLGAARAGSNAAYVAVPEDRVVLLPDNLSDEQATLAEPVGYAVHVVEMLALKPEDVLVVIGMGPIGLFVLQAARHYGTANVYAVDTNEERLAIAQTLGAAAALNPLHDNVAQVIEDATGGVGAHAVVDAVGSTAVRQSALSLIRRQGTVIFSGLHTAETSLPINDMVRNEVQTRGAFAYQDAQFRRAVDLIAQGAVGLQAQWIVKAPLADGAHWYDQLINNPGGTAKVLLVPEY